MSWYSRRDQKAKTPLEQLLEETDSQDESFEPLSPSSTIDHEDISQETLETELNALSEDLQPLTPQDLTSSTFINDFKSKSQDKDFSPYESETSVSDIKEIKEEPVEKVTYTTELERKSKIEKERAARKKRLWELTRGF